MPLPVTGVALVIVTQVGTLVTDHVQAAGAFTVTEPLPPAVANVGLVAGDTVAPQHGPAACDTEWVAPATLKVALRAAPLLAATE